MRRSSFLPRGYVRNAEHPDNVAEYLLSSHRDHVLLIILNGFRRIHIGCMPSPTEGKQVILCASQLDAHTPAHGHTPQGPEGKPWNTGPCRYSQRAIINL